MKDIQIAQDLNLNKYHIITFVIILFFGILSIEYQNMIGAISGYYFILIILILNKNLQKDYFRTLIYCVFLICVNEFLIRILGKIKINSDGNPWACLFFYQTIFISFITLLVLTIINTKKNVTNRILYLILSLFLISVVYFFITKPL